MELNQIIINGMEDITASSHAYNERSPLEILIEIIDGKDINKYIYKNAKKLIKTRLSNIKSYLDNFVEKDYDLCNEYVIYGRIVIIRDKDIRRIIEDYYRIHNIKWYEKMFFVPNVTSIYKYLVYIFKSDNIEYYHWKGYLTINKKK